MQIQSMPNPFLQGQPAEDMTARFSQQRSSLHAEVNNVTQNAEMTLYTEEGDKVTLSMNSSLQTAYARYTESGGMVGPGVMKAEHTDTKLSETAFEKQMGITVEGELSDQERKDIRKAVKAMGRMMRDFMAGDTAKMAKRAFKIKGLESVAGLEVSLGYEKSSVSLDQTRQTTEAVLTAPVGLVSDDDDDLADQVEDLTERMMKPVRERELNLDHLSNTVDRMFGKFNDYDPEDGMEADNFKELVSIIRSRFFEKLDAFRNENSAEGFHQAQLAGRYSESD